MANFPAKLPSTYSLYISCQDVITEDKRFQKMRESSITLPEFCDKCKDKWFLEWFVI